MQKQYVNDEMLVAPRPSKITSNFWARGRVFGGLWARDIGLRVSRVRLSHFALLSCHETHFSVVRKILQVVYGNNFTLCASFCQLDV